MSDSVSTRKRDFLKGAAVLGAASGMIAAGTTTPRQVYAQMLTGLALANDPQSKVVATNLVQGEDGLNSMQYFSLHM